MGGSRSLGPALLLAAVAVATWPPQQVRPEPVAADARPAASQSAARRAMPWTYDPAAPHLPCDTSCHTQPRHRREEMHRAEACTTCHMSARELERGGLVASAEREAGGAAAGSGSETAPAGRPAREGVLVEDQLEARMRLKGRPLPPVAAPLPAPEGMVHVPAGEFLMGSNMRWEDEAPEHAIWLHDYFIDRHEVTNAEYGRFVAASGHRAPKHWGGAEPPEALARHPVTYVDWHDAQAFCRWAGKRLPSEQEWEKAARGTDGRQYPWGNVFHEERSNNPQKESKGTEPVGSYEEGKSPYGLYDMSGNVWEWVDAWYKPHPGNEVPNAEYGEKSRISKGGSWYSCLFYNCGISAPAYNRAFLGPETANSSLGFRCVKDVKADEAK